MQTYYVTQQRQRDAIPVRMNLNDAETVNLDFSQWAKLNGNVSAVAWAVKSGNVSVSGTSLASNVAQAVFTGSQRTRARIVAQAVSGSQTINITFLVRVIEPIDFGTWDYGWITQY